MKSKLLIILIIFSLLSFPMFNNDYIDITHMVSLSSIGISYEENKINIHSYVINNTSMSKTDYNTSSSNNNSIIIKTTNDTFEEAFFDLMNSTALVVDFSHIETLILHTSVFNEQLIKELTNYIVNQKKFYPKFNIYVTNENLNEIYNINFLNDTSSYYTLLTEYKSDIEYHKTTFIDLTNDFYEDNFFIMYPCIKLNKNILSNNEIKTSISIDGYYYFDKDIKKIQFNELPLLYFLYSTNDVIFKITNENYYLSNYSLRTFKLHNKLYLLYYIKSTYQDDLKFIIKDLIISLYNEGIDVLICGGIGGGAQNALAQAGIKLYGGVAGNCDAAVEALLAGSLNYNPNVECSHHGEGHSCSGGCGEHGCGSHGCGDHGCH